MDLQRLRREFALVRKRGFAINNQLTEPGVTAVGVAVHDPAGQPNAAISISMPSVRFHRDRLTTWVNELITTAAVIERDLHSHTARFPGGRLPRRAGPQEPGGGRLIRPAVSLGSRGRLWPNVCGVSAVPAR